MHLGIDFSRMLADSGGQVGAMRPPKCPKTPQLGAQDGPEAAQETPKPRLNNSEWPRLVPAASLAAGAGMAARPKFLLF